MNIHQTEAHGAFLKAIGWRVVSHRFKGVTTYYFLKKIPLIPVHFLKIQRLPLELIDWNFVGKMESYYRVVETVVEIDQLSQTPVQITKLQELGFKTGHDFMLTTKTRIIDLTKSELQLIETMKPKTRYNLKKTGKEGLTIKISSLEEVVNKPKQFETDYELLRLNAKRIKMLLLPKKWIQQQWQAFQKNGFVVEIRKGEQMIALATFYTSDTTCSYNLNGSTLTGRRLLAPTLAVWEGIKEGKRRRLPVFDFDGVFDERYPRSQRRFGGFGRFKAGFGGVEVYFPPMYRKRNLSKVFDLA